MANLIGLVGIRSWRVALSSSRLTGDFANGDILLALDADEPRLSVRLRPIVLVSRGGFLGRKTGFTIHPGDVERGNPQDYVNSSISHELPPELVWRRSAPLPFYIHP